MLVRSYKDQGYNDDPKVSYLVKPKNLRKSIFRGDASISDSISPLNTFPQVGFLHWTIIHISTGGILNWLLFGRDNRWIGGRTNALAGSSTFRPTWLLLSFSIWIVKNNSQIKNRTFFKWPLTNCSNWTMPCSPLLSWSTDSSSR